jgi:hypothetical protein
MPKMPENFGSLERAAEDCADSALRSLLTEIIRHCPKSRQQIADELSSRLGLRVTVHMLNDFTSEGKKPARFPACFVASLCEIVGSDELQRFILSERLRKLLDFAEREVAARLEQRNREALLEDLSANAKKRKGQCAG